jgi:pimeloyl-ACP methyl ester carboxylesterase
MISDHWIDHPQGRLFARSWRPRPSDAGQPAILLFHDSLGCVELWRDFPEALARMTRRPVVAYDRLGFGRSDPYPGTLAADFLHAEAKQSVPALMSQLGLDRLIPFGYSVGGAMAVATAGQMPESCPALVTMAAQAFVEDLTVVGLEEAQRTFSADDQIERLARYHGAKARWVLSAWIDTWLSPEFAGWTLDADLARVHCPLLALHGENDEYGSLVHPQRITRLTQGPSEMVIVPDCGHVPHREQPEVVLQAVGRFLAASGASDS